MMFIAQELRESMAQLGFRKLDDMIGRVECLDPDDAIEHWKARHIDLSALLHKPDVGPEVALNWIQPQDHGLANALDRQLVQLCKDALAHKKPVHVHLPVRDVNRTLGTALSSAASPHSCAAALP